MHLRQDFVSQAAVADGTDHFFCVQVLRKPQFDAAGVFKRLYLFRSERQVEAREIVLQLRKLSRANDGDDWHIPVLLPCQRNLRHTATELIGDSLHGGNDTLGPLLLRDEVLHHVVVHSARLRRALTVVLAG
jgi:hypothetical protein